MAKLAMTPVLVKLTGLPDIDCKRYGIMALSNLASNVDTRAAATRAGGLQAAVLMARDKDLDCRRYAAICLANMANSHATQAQIIVHGALGPILELARSADAELKRHTSGVLCNLACNESNHPPMVARDVIPILLELSQAPEADIRDYATFGLGNLCSNFEYVPLIGRVRGARANFIHYPEKRSMPPASVAFFQPPVFLRAAGWRGPAYCSEWQLEHPRAVHGPGLAASPCHVPGQSPPPHPCGRHRAHRCRSTIARGMSADERATGSWE